MVEHELPADQQPARGRTIPGRSSLAHLQDNMKVADVVVSDADVAELKAV